ncbi:hypothetical protein ACFL38_05365 [Candidatus Omnitrophota bacterium]
MENSSKKDFVCHDCFTLKRCKEPIQSWIFFFVALIATIAIRAVNVALDFNPLLAKIFWYIGVAGFFIFFIYKFKIDRALRREIQRTKLTDKLLSKEQLSSHDYEILGTILCRLNSKKDGINYFFIFFFSGLALALAIYVDFFK